MIDVEDDFFFKFHHRRIRRCMGICAMMDIVVATAGSDIDQFVYEGWTYMLCDLTSRGIF